MAFRHLATLCWLPVAIAAVVALPGGARAGEPYRVTPEKQTRRERREARRTKDMSDGGTRRGIIEFTLGGVTAAGSLALIGRGAWELVEGNRLLDECDDFTGDRPPECGNLVPDRGHKIAAGLSFGFAVPMALASGFLFARGARIRRDHKTWQRRQATPSVSLAPVVGRRGASLHLTLRF